MWTTGVLLVALSLVCVHGGPVRVKRADEMTVRNLLQDVRRALENGPVDQPETAKNDKEIANLSQDQIQRILDVFAEKQGESERSLEEAPASEQLRSLEDTPGYEEERGFEDPETANKEARDWSWERPSFEDFSYDKRGEEVPSSLDQEARSVEEAAASVEALDQEARSLEEAPASVEALDQEARSLEEAPASLQARDWSWERPSFEDFSYDKRGDDFPEEETRSNEELPNIDELPVEGGKSARSFEEPEERSFEEPEERSFEEPEARSAETLPFLEDIPVENDEPENREFTDEAERSEEAQVPEDDDVPPSLRETAFKRGLSESQIDRVLDIIHEKQGAPKGETRRGGSLEEPEADPPSTDLFTAGDEKSVETRSVLPGVTKEQLKKLASILKDANINARSEEAPVEEAREEGARALPAEVTTEQLHKVLAILKDKMGNKNEKKSEEVAVENGDQADELTQDEVKRIVKHVHKSQRTAEEAEEAKFDVSSQKFSDNNDTPEESARERLERVLDVLRETNAPVEK